MNTDWLTNEESAPLSSREGQGSESALTLFELNSLVRDVLEATLDRDYWVEAELSEAREVIATWNWCRRMPLATLPWHEPRPNAGKAHG